jgi:hypothetical protein
MGLLRPSRPVLALALALSLAPAAAWARGAVLRVEGDRVFVDLGAADGLRPGGELVLYHAILAVHPVTGKQVRDTFPLGKLIVERAGEHLAIVVADSVLATRVAVGDEVELPGEAQPVPDPWLESIAARVEAARATRDPEAVERDRRREAATREVAAETEAREAWEQTLGQPPGRRIELWLAYLERFPGGPLTDAVRGEVDRLRAELRTEEQALARARARHIPGGPGLGPGRGPGLGPGDALLPRYQRDGVVLSGPLAWMPPRRATDGEAVELAFSAPQPGSVRAGWVHARGAGEATYRRLALEPAGDGALRAVIPRELVRPPAVEYFVEVLAAEASAPTAVIGRADAPVALPVDPVPAEPPPDVVGRSRVTLIFDWVDFDSRTGMDHYLQGEADFMYRFRSPIWSLRLGVAAMTGRGGDKAVIDEAYEAGRAPCTDARGAFHCRRVDFSYVYTELELHASEVVAVMLRPLYGRGSRDDSPDETRPEFVNALGARLRLRLGRETETNLALGAALTEGFGTLYEAAFTWDVIPRLPVVLSAQVTDQPVPGDFGVRLIADVGWRGLRWMVPSLRVAYQARNIKHAGVSTGAALSFDW